MRTSLSTRTPGPACAARRPRLPSRRGRRLWLLVHSVIFSFWFGLIGIRRGRNKGPVVTLKAAAPAWDGSLGIPSPSSRISTSVVPPILLGQGEIAARQTTQPRPFPKALQGVMVPGVGALAG